jgi:transcriptional regulator with XRE-family HTH domain
MAKKAPPRWYLDEWVAHRGLTREALAAMIDTSSGYLSDISKGKRRYNEDTLDALCLALDITKGELFGVNPLDEDDRADVVLQWSTLDSEARQTLADMAKVLAKRSGRRGGS